MRRAISGGPGAGGAKGWSIRRRRVAVGAERPRCERDVERNLSAAHAAAGACGWAYPNPNPNPNLTLTLTLTLTP